MTKEFKIPTSPTEPKGDLVDQSILLYGMPKIGKSTFAASFPNALFLPCEPGLNHLRHHQIPSEGIIESWTEMSQACKAIAAGEHPFKTIIIDTVDNMYQLCADHICGKRGVEYTGDIAHGKGWSLVANEFMRVIKRLAGLPYGLILISHAKERTIEVNGIESVKVTSTLTESARKLLDGIVDMILYVDVDQVTTEDGGKGYRRVIRTKPSNRFMAGDRTGRLPAVIEMEAGAPFRNFEAAWNKGKQAAPPAKQDQDQTQNTEQKKEGKAK